MQKSIELTRITKKFHNSHHITLEDSGLFSSLLLLIIMGSSCSKNEAREKELKKKKFLSLLDLLSHSLLL